MAYTSQIWGQVREFASRILARSFASDRTARTAAALLAATGACGPDNQATSNPEPLYFVEGRQAYEVGELVAQLAQTDERVSLFGVSDIIETDAGYLVAEGGNQRLVLFDCNLNPVGVNGGEGDGPGEYRFPRKLALAGNRVAVLDQGNNRVSYVAPDGTFIEGQNVRPNPSDLAYHPELGLLVADDQSDDHYLSRYSGSRRNPIARIPAELRTAPAGIFQLRSDLVAVTPDGGIHVFDGRQLALASYRADGTFVRTTFLPEPQRSQRLERQARRVEALGGPSRVLNSSLAAILRPIFDGQLFIRITLADRHLGYVLDAETSEAIPIVVAQGDERTLWMQGTGGARFATDRMILFNRRDGPQMAVATVELVER